LTNLSSLSTSSNNIIQNKNSDDNFFIFSSVRNLIYSGVIPFIIDIISRPLSYLSDSGDHNHSFSTHSSRFSFSTVSLLLLEQSLWCLANFAGESEDVVYYLINYKVGDSDNNRITDNLSYFSSSSSINSSNDNNVFQ
jgi:hypothetical protein